MKGSKGRVRKPDQDRAELRFRRYLAVAARVGEGQESTLKRVMAVPNVVLGSEWLVLLPAMPSYQVIGGFKLNGADVVNA